ncbi:MAG: AMP-binding protein, partial [Bacteroidota bacterium]|nr:AMP-binding protein [Bacteroidota bacterium]
MDANPRNPEILGYTQFGTVSLALASITFDVSIMEEFIPLAHGLTICMANEEQIHNPLALSQLMLEHKVDIMTCTPSFLSNIIDLPQLRQALARIASYDFGAEAFPAALYDKICAIRPDAYIMNGYGPSETTISCTMSVINSSDCITIGKPAANVQAQILDDQGNALPVGALGELVICGEGVGAGYIGLDELTREKFITINGLKAYRTGDLAQWSPDGDIVFHGRID